MLAEPRHGLQSAEYTRKAFTFRNGQLKLAKMDAPLDIAWSRPLPDQRRGHHRQLSRDS
jgi:putative transposase